MPSEFRMFWHGITHTHTKCLMMVKIDFGFNGQNMNRNKMRSSGWKTASVQRIHINILLVGIE